MRAIIKQKSHDGGGLYILPQAPCPARSIHASTPRPDLRSAKCPEEAAERGEVHLKIFPVTEESGRLKHLTAER